MKNKEYYIAKIIDAGSAELIIVNYELAIYHMNESFQYIIHSKEIYQNHISLSRKFILNLMVSLDMTHGISKNLLSLYIYIDKLLAKSYFNFEKENIVESIKIMEELLEGWKIATKSKIFENHPRVFSGLTYNKNGLCEYVEKTEERVFNM